MMVKLVQQQLSAMNIISKENHLITLDPYLDEDNLLRVRERLQANLPEDTKNQMVLPANHPLTIALIRLYHAKYLYAGPQLVTTALRQKFWIVRGKNIVKKIIRQCTRCFRRNPLAVEQPVGELPRCRVQLNYPFYNTGVDVAGPVTILQRNKRSTVNYKGYIAVCMATRAVHLELVGVLTSKVFIAALQRFISRRGKCGHIFSDNGRNFTGAKRILEELGHLFLSELHQTSIVNFCSKEGMEWHFQPPYGPNFGGSWEAAVKSTKSHLRVVLGNVTMTYEEMSTILVRIEGILNSRPLCPQSTDPTDLNVITPGHFLIFRPMNDIPEPDFSVTNTPLMKR
ncbi:uncharacterized protein LOC135700609 [Ochlerotatus camptorhynchus]|uniref:uncharacterized protein LOC135700609 n=1 Tax=Ochlerotatus camptorhynchus TaxID=644619 RepID=UPI0031D49ABB